MTYRPLCQDIIFKNVVIQIIKNNAFKDIIYVTQQGDRTIV